MSAQDGIESIGSQAQVDPGSLYESLVENLPIYVIRKDRDGKICFVNRLFADLLETEPAELIGKTDLDLFPRELAEKYLNDDAKLMASGEPFQGIEENVIGDTTRYFEVRKTVVRDSDNNILGTQAVFWDVTDRRKKRKSALDLFYIWHSGLWCHQTW